ncbi:alpha/beta fold hydrolase [Actinomycetospora endophytica]|uniref:Alpha/beta fold hydrolase n=1 Tax=Actinomycetospora endophytica TaxID=2291215 RepID=A0ABS8PAW4_9PSEU|nr:alpha/beta fold hydrolase [Actinomycetospora endophytica]MCD2195391.1 alpha/beta fold hydrolase [Actinomycetospora endophytica]
MPVALTTHRVALDGITLNVVEGGEGPAVLLLHGFPDRATLWQHQIEGLAEQGYRVIAPDLRGFGDSDRPAEVGAYGVRTVIGDLLALLDHLGVGEVRVAAHDWGAAVAWALTAFAPGRVSRLAAFSVGHPHAFAGAGYVQKQLSWYMLWFQFPGVAETQMPADDWHWYRDWAHGGTARGVDPLVDQQLADLDRPGALTAGLNWYRAGMPPEIYAATGGPLEMPAIRCPVLGVWSDGDLALTERQMTDSQRYVAGSWRYERIPRVGHWIPAHAPARTTEMLLEHFA